MEKPPVSKYRKGHPPKKTICRNLGFSLEIYSAKKSKMHRNPIACPNSYDSLLCRIVRIHTGMRDIIMFEKLCFLKMYDDSTNTVNAFSVYINAPTHEETKN